MHIRLEKFGDSQSDLDIDLLDAQNGLYGRLCDQPPLCLDRNEFNLASTYCVSKVPSWLRLTDSLILTDYR